jgi:hypothetical protein
MVQQDNTSHLQTLLQFVTLLLRCMICALTLPSTSVIHDLYDNLCPRHQLASPINWLNEAFRLIPITNASHPWLAKPVVQTWNTYISILQLFRYQKKTAPDLSHAPNLLLRANSTLFASIHRYIRIVIPFIYNLIHTRWFMLSCKGYTTLRINIAVGSTAHYYYTSTPVPIWASSNIIHVHVLLCNNGECKM